MFRNLQIDSLHRQQLGLHNYLMNNSLNHNLLNYLLLNIYLLYKFHNHLYYLLHLFSLQFGLLDSYCLNI